MRRPKLVRQSGPYICHSISQDGQGVRIVIYPAFPHYNDPGKFDWVESRYEDAGGGPSIFAALALAEEIGKFLNSPYDPEAVKLWEQKRQTILRHLEKKASMVTARGRRKAGSNTPV